MQVGRQTGFRPACLKGNSTVEVASGQHHGLINQVDQVDQRRLFRRCPNQETDLSGEGTGPDYSINHPVQAFLHGIAFREFHGSELRDAGYGTEHIIEIVEKCGHDLTDGVQSVQIDARGANRATGSRQLVTFGLDHEQIHPLAFRVDQLGLPGGGTTMLESVAKIYVAGGPNTINREQVRRRIIIQCNTAGRGLVDVVHDIRARLKPIEQALPTGYFVAYEGQFESQQSASRMIAVLFAVALVGVFLVLYSMFRSANLSLQVMIALPMAFIGSVAALELTGQTLTVAAMVGFISLCGIASRNGILLINHYLHLVKYEGETWSREMIIRAGQERLAPVLMTALTSGIGLVPLAMAAGEPGKEILYPVATVIIGGLVSSTLLEFLVRPALFWKFGFRAAERVTEQTDELFE